MILSYVDNFTWNMSIYVLVIHKYMAYIHMSVLWYVYIYDMYIYIYIWYIYYLYDYICTYIWYIIIYVCVLWLDMANWSEQLSSFEPRHRSSSCRASTAMARCLSGRPRLLKAVLGWNGHGMTDSMDWFTQWPFQETKLEVPSIYKAYIRPM
jgi:hypothetical protein